MGLDLGYYEGGAARVVVGHDGIGGLGKQCVIHCQRQGGCTGDHHLIFCGPGHAIEGLHRAVVELQKYGVLLVLDKGAVLGGSQHQAILSDDLAILGILAGIVRHQHTVADGEDIRLLGRLELGIEVAVAHLVVGPPGQEMGLDVVTDPERIDLGLGVDGAAVGGEIIGQHRAVVRRLPLDLDPVVLLQGTEPVGACLGMRDLVAVVEQQHRAITCLLKLQFNLGPAPVGPAEHSLADGGQGLLQRGVAVAEGPAPLSGELGPEVGLTLIDGVVDRIHVQLGYGAPADVGVEADSAEDVRRRVGWIQGGCEG